MHIRIRNEIKINLNKMGEFKMDKFERGELGFNPVVIEMLARNRREKEERRLAEYEAYKKTDEYKQKKAEFEESKKRFIDSLGTLEWGK